jgi:hypothetical protein
MKVFHQPHIQIGISLRAIPESWEIIHLGKFYSVGNFLSAGDLNLLMCGFQKTIPRTQGITCDKLFNP